MQNAKCRILGPAVGIVKRKGDGYENNEVLLLAVDEVLERTDLTNMSREILKAYKENKTGLNKSDYIAKSCDESNYAIFGV